MGNILTINQSNQIPIHNYIKKGSYPGSAYYKNNFLREWIAENNIDVNIHRWLPLGVNYSTLYRTTNNGIICEVYQVRSYFSKTQLTIQNHLANVQILNDNCYVLLSSKQQKLLQLDSYVEEEPMDKLKQLTHELEKNRDQVIETLNTLDIRIEESDSDNESNTEESGSDQDITDYEGYDLSEYAGK